jgi:predicted secreted hydrolase
VIGRGVFVRLAVLALVAASCSGGPILANPTLAPVTPPLPSPSPSHPPDPQPIIFPRDEGPHDRLTEWWYYTGHLTAEDGRRFGFEAVVFRAERGGVPVSWASHLALTDESADRFLYAQRSEIGPQVDRSPRSPDGTANGFTLMVSGDVDPEAPRPIPRWQLSGTGGHHVIVASLSPQESAIAGGSFLLNLELLQDRQPTLHDGDGWIDFGPAGSSYYYSVTRLRAGGILGLGDIEQLRVSGDVWFDHQWGDFISVGGGGWDWFAVNLDDGTDLTISLVRAADGTVAGAYGTLMDSTGDTTHTTTHLDRSAFEVVADPSRTWTSPATGATYPVGWTIRIPEADLVIDLEPTVANQELDTRATTGVVYWEGSQVVRATRHGVPLGGEAYVELTGYAPAVR